jgi:hypothetical protein
MKSSEKFLTFVASCETKIVQSIRMSFGSEVGALLCLLT